MKKLTSYALFALVGAGLACRAAQADVSYNVSLNTTSLATALDGPFSVDFQFNQGDGTVVNTVTITDFTGVSFGSPTLIGDASGKLSSTVRLDDQNAAFNEFTQAFAANGNPISFNLTISTNVGTTTPDLFAISILNENLLPILTTDAAASTFVAINIDSHNPTPQTFSSDPNSPDQIGAAAVTPQSSAVPTPSSLAQFAAFVATMIGCLAAYRLGNHVSKTRQQSA